MTRLSAIVCLAFIAICTSALCAGSIFDEDAPSAPAPKHDAVKPPPAMKPDPEETPPPTPTPVPPPPATDVPGETPKPTPARQTPSGDGPSVSLPSADNARLKKEKDTEAGLQAKALADLATAKANAEKRANADPDYIKASAAVDESRKAYEEAKRTASSVDEKSAALTAMSQAISNKESLYRRVVDGDHAYVEAKKAAAKYASATPSVVPAKEKETVSPEIAQAIASRNFIEGMTVRQARQAAKLPSEMVHAEGSTKTYRWYVKGRTGTFTTVNERSYGGRIVSHQVADFGVIAYVEGIFVDDKLTTFQRYSLVQRNNGRNNGIYGSD